MFEIRNISDSRIRSHRSINLRNSNNVRRSLIHRYDRSVFGTISATSNEQRRPWLQPSLQRTGIPKISWPPMIHVDADYHRLLVIPTISDGQIRSRKPLDYREAHKVSFVQSRPLSSCSVWNPEDLRLLKYSQTVPNFVGIWSAHNLRRCTSILRRSNVRNFQRPSLANENSEARWLTGS